ncbi:hypothetical protein [Labilibaculum sp.]|uniref:hypothetical protein n=1 Tax=Labilibaculum sp. TaxID=2060723 RepID=UPI003567526B
MRSPFNQKNLNKFIQDYSGNENFAHIVLPRLKLLYAIKKELKNISEIEWYVEFSHADINLNRVVLQYIKSKNNDFNFYYEIPLNSKFELRVFLSNSSIHFIDLYNFLLEKKIIEKDQYKIKAAYHTIPHFILNTETRRYDMSILSKLAMISEKNEDLIDEKVKKEILIATQIFNPIFDQIIAQFKI